MRTKEETLHGNGVATTNFRENLIGVFEAMDSYAKEMCIAYGHWLFKRLGYVHDDKPPQDESEQLFNHFLKSIKP